jgi:DNA-binding HxlR family transcriptional regulator
MQRASFAHMECPIAQALEQVGEGWTLLILREAFKGARCFADFEERLGMAPNTLAARLRKLCKHGLFRRRRYQSHPPRAEYQLTEKARELLPILLALGEWGNRWLYPTGPLLVPVDAATGEPIELDVVDRRTSRPVRAGGVALSAGPSASAGLKAALRSPLMLGAKIEESNDGSSHRK